MLKASTNPKARTNFARTRISLHLPTRSEGEHRLVTHKPIRKCSFDTLRTTSFRGRVSRTGPHPIQARAGIALQEARGGLNKKDVREKGRVLLLGGRRSPTTS